MGDFVGAAEAFQQAIAIRKVTLRRHHPDVGVSYVRKGVCDFALGSFDTAVESMEKALRCCHDESVVKAKILNNLGVMHYHRQDLIQSLKGFAGALEIQRHSLAGPIKRESIVFDASMTLCNMGKLFLEKGDYAAAYSVYEEGLTLQTIAFSRKSILVMLSLGNLAYCKAKNSEPKKALQIYKRVLRLQEGMYGDESREVMETVGVMGLLYHQIKDYKKAQAHLTRVSRWQMYFMNARNPAVQQIKEYLKKIEGKLEEEESAVWI